MECIHSRFSLALMLFVRILSQVGVTLAALRSMSCTPIVVRAAPCATWAVNMKHSSAFAVRASFMAVVPHTTALLARESHHSGRHALCQSACAPSSPSVSSPFELEPCIWHGHAPKF
jgi:hypothetical protein